MKSAKSRSKGALVARRRGGGMFLFVGVQRDQIKSIDRSAAGRERKGKRRATQFFSGKTSLFRRESSSLRGDTPTRYTIPQGRGEGESISEFVAGISTFETVARPRLTGTFSIPITSAETVVSAPSHRLCSLGIAVSRCQTASRSGRSA